MEREVEKEAKNKLKKEVKKEVKDVKKDVKEDIKKDVKKDVKEVNKIEKYVEKNISDGNKERNTSDTKTTVPQLTKKATTLATKANKAEEGKKGRYRPNVHLMPVPKVIPLHICAQLIDRHEPHDTGCVGGRSPGAGQLSESRLRQSSILNHFHFGHGFGAVLDSPFLVFALSRRPNSCHCIVMDRRTPAPTNNAPPLFSSLPS